ncbi:MAG: hypothetical protein JSS57_04780 [Proteobacteria bacterium]|nr:hypothetical protein [Pseudomonadota bacterium]
MSETIIATNLPPSTHSLAPLADASRHPHRPLLEDVHARKLQLRALLAVTLDEQGGVLRTQSQEMREGFLLACSVMGEEVRQLAQVLHVRLSASQAA